MPSYHLTTQAQQQPPVGVLTRYAIVATASLGELRPLLDPVYVAQPAIPAVGFLSRASDGTLTWASGGSGVITDNGDGTATF